MTLVVKELESEKGWVRGRVGCRYAAPDFPPFSRQDRAKEAWAIQRLQRTYMVGDDGLEPPTFSV
jgi:hypothetical protein